MSACMPSYVLMCVMCVCVAVCRCAPFATPVAFEQNRKSLFQSVLMLHRFLMWTLITQKTFSPLPGLWAVSRSLHQRWWLIWRRRRRRGGSFLQLELSPSGNTHGQKNAISRRFKLNTRAQKCFQDWLLRTAVTQKAGFNSTEIMRILINFVIYWLHIIIHIAFILCDVSDQWWFTSLKMY